jgi:hypothetical protein
MSRKLGYGEPGSFWWCVRSFDLGDPLLTTVARLVCQLWTVWPQDLVGYEIAYPAVTLPGHAPLATGLSDGPCTDRRIVGARRYIWCILRRCTDLTAQQMGDALGGFSAATVRAAWRCADDFPATTSEFERDLVEGLNDTHNSAVA